jgi:hypothetical protein
MKNKLLILSIFLFIMLGLTKLQAQNMYVKESNNTQTTYALNNIRKLTFSSGNLTVQKNDNSTNEYALNSLRYLNFVDLTTNINEQPAQLNNNLFIYPNPIKDILNIDLTNTKSDGSISILSLNGKVLHSEKVINNTIITINLNHLPQGIYLCRYSSALEIKTVKIIKQ